MAERKDKPTHRLTFSRLSKPCVEPVELEGYLRQGSRQASQRPCLFSAEVLVDEILRSKMTRPDKPLSALGILGSSLSVLIGMEVCRV